MPFSTMRWAMPKRPQISRLCWAWQIERLPKLTVSSSSSSTDGTPRRASDNAKVGPAMPAPTITTGRREPLPSSSAGRRYG